MLAVLHKRDCVFNTKMFLVESLLYHGGKVVILGSKFAHGKCLDERIEFLDETTVIQMAGKKSVFSRILDKLHKKNYYSSIGEGRKTAIIVPENYRISLKESEIYSIVPCDKEIVEWIIVYLNENHISKSSSYERFVENAKRAEF